MVVDCAREPFDGLWGKTLPNIKRQLLRNVLSHELKNFRTDPFAPITCFVTRHLSQSTPDIIFAGGQGQSRWFAISFVRARRKRLADIAVRLKACAGPAFAGKLGQGQSETT